MLEKLKYHFLYIKFRTLILYGLIGCLSTSLDFALYSALINLFGINYLMANCLSVTAGIVTSFLMNRAYNFKVKDKTTQRFAIFLTVGLCGLAMSSGILYVCIQILGVNKLASKVLSIIIVVFLQFLANKHITFKSKKENF